MTADSPRQFSSPLLTRRSMLQGSAIALGALGLAACSGGSSGSKGAASGEAQSEAAALGFHPDALVVGSLPKPTVQFTDHNNELFDFAGRTDGRLTLLFFGYTSCPDQCPVYLNNVTESLKKSEGVARATNVLFVGTDTARDTPERMKEYLGARNADFVGLTASPEAIDEALAALYLPSVTIPEDTSGNYAVGHPLQCVAFTPDNLCHLMYPYDLRQSEWVDELAKLVAFDWSDVAI